MDTGKKVRASEFTEVKRKSNKPRKLIKGIGVNDSQYKVTRRDGLVLTKCPYYSRWISLINKCANTDFTICDDWLTFSKFRKWMEKQNWEGDRRLNLTLFRTKHYSPETACFLTRRASCAFDDKSYQKSQYPTGVTYLKDRRIYNAQCSTEGIQCTIGYSKTEAGAYKMYIDFKHAHMLVIASEHEGAVKAAMLTFADELLSVYNSTL